MLVVDDEPMIVELLCVGLRAHGFEVQPAEDGRVALRVARDFRPQVVVLDVMLPDLDRFEVCRRLRADGTEAPAGTTLRGSDRGVSTSRSSGIRCTSGTGA